MNNRIVLRIQCLFIFLGMSAISADTCASFECYNEKHFPSVFKLKQTNKGVEVLLGGAYADSGLHVAPVLVYREDGAWSLVERRKCEPCETNVHDEKCQETIPEWNKITPEDQDCQSGENCLQGIPVISLQPQNEAAEVEESPSACAVNNNIVWFGINFYRGEGTTGYGGLGRFDRKANKLQIRRLPALKDYPIHKVVWDGENLWAATTSNYECTGHEPALGLIKYKWNTKELTVFKGSNDGPCGFVIHDLLLSKGFLWVATDVGSSRWDAKSEQWTHYLPDVKSPAQVKEGRCEIFYNDLLETLPRNETWFGEDRSYYQVFYDNLKKFRPDFIKAYESR